MIFTKMHGLGNDFMVIDTTHQPFELSAKQIASLADRHTGVGFDQCLIVAPSDCPGVDFVYKIFNADGGEVGQCGNGARCLARFIHAKGLSDKNPITVGTTTATMQLHINPDDSVTVNLGKPKFAAKDIPLQGFETQNRYEFVTPDGTYHCHAVNVGNPHIVLKVDNVDDCEVDEIGSLLSTHEKLPQHANVGFMQIVDNQHIKLRVYERGVGETKACGSGAVAAALCAIKYHQLEPQVKVSLSGGELAIAWPDQADKVLLTGPAEFVYEGMLCE